MKGEKYEKVESIIIELAETYVDFIFATGLKLNRVGCINQVIGQPENYVEVASRYLSEGIKGKYTGGLRDASVRINMKHEIQLDNGNKFDVNHIFQVMSGTGRIGIAEFKGLILSVDVNNIPNADIDKENLLSLIKKSSELIMEAKIKELIL